MVGEPILRRADLEAWDVLRRTALTHARTRLHARRLDSARAMIGQALDAAPRWCLMWSAGKDSTALTHLVRVEMGLDVEAASEKDDLDYPGEREYVERLAATWGLRLSILVPPISPRQWIADHTGELSAEGDMHSRAAGLSKACFYDLVEAHGAAYDGIFLGLRSRESRGRALNRATHGRLYRKRPSRMHAAGQWVCTPLADWDGLDVYAYLFAHDVPMLDVYRCIAFRDREEPWRVRKSWWIPGADARWGGVAWLRHYWPSLYRQLCEWLPDARRLG